MFARAREKARTASCQSNLKQIGTASLMYVQDYDETYPPGLVGASGAQGPVTQNGAFTTFWNSMDVIYPYVQNRQLFFCPSSQSTSTYAGNYGVNSRLCPDLRSSGSGISLATVSSPASTIMCLDAGPYFGDDGYITSPTGSFWYYPATCLGRDPTGTNSTYPLSGFYQTDFVNGRHNNGLNICFADGHVKWSSGSTLYGNSPAWWVP